MRQAQYQRDKAIYYKVLVINGKMLEFVVVAKVQELRYMAQAIILPQLLTVSSEMNSSLVAALRVDNSLHLTELIMRAQNRLATKSALELVFTDQDVRLMRQRSGAYNPGISNQSFCCLEDVVALFSIASGHRLRLNIDECSVSY